MNTWFESSPVVVSPSPVKVCVEIVRTTEEGTYLSLCISDLPRICGGWESVLNDTWK